MDYFVEESSRCGVDDASVVCLKARTALTCKCSVVLNDVCTSPSVLFICDFRTHCTWGGGVIWVGVIASVGSFEICSAGKVSQPPVSRSNA